MINNGETLITVWKGVLTRSGSGAYTEQEPYRTGNDAGSFKGGA
jgi:hypothetical protein